MGLVLKLSAYPKYIIGKRSGKPSWFNGRAYKLVNAVLATVLAIYCSPTVVKTLSRNLISCRIQYYDTKLFTLVKRTITIKGEISTIAHRLLSTTHLNLPIKFAFIWFQTSEECDDLLIQPPLSLKTYKTILVWTWYEIPFSWIPQKLDPQQRMSKSLLFNEVTDRGLFVGVGGGGLHFGFEYLLDQINRVIIRTQNIGLYLLEVAWSRFSICPSP